MSSSHSSNTHRASPTSAVEVGTELVDVFQQNRERLRQLIRLRLHPRLQGRLDESDVVQDAFLDANRRFAEYTANPAVSLFLWLRSLTLQRLVDLQRLHLGAQMRDAGRELSLHSVSLHNGPMPEASSLFLAEQLVGQMTSVSQAAIRAETQVRVQAALNLMDPIDREVLALRHFEMLTNEEVAQVLGLKKTAASNRYIRALRRMKGVLEGAGMTSGDKL